MPRLLRLPCIFVLLALLGAHAGRAQPRSFDDYFTPVDTISLSTDVLVGDVASMDVDHEGRLLLIDRVTRVVLLFDADGSYIRTLSVEDCNPGFEMFPIQAVFNGDEIFLSNSGAWGYRFNADGTCKGPVDGNFRPGGFMVAEPAVDGNAATGMSPGDLFLVRADPTGHFIRRHDFTGRPVQDFQILTEMPNFVNRVTPKVVMIARGTIYLIRPFRPTTLEFDRAGNLVREFGEIPADFREIDADPVVQRGNVQAMMRTFGRALAENSTVLWAGLLDEETVLVQYSRRRGDRARTPSLFAYNMDGDVVIPPVDWETYPYFVGGGLVYAIDESRVDGENALNPDVVVYRRRPE